MHGDLSDALDVVIVEDIWAEPFERLGTTFRVGRDPKAWSDPVYLRHAVSQARAVVVRNQTKVTAELLDAAPRLELVARAGVGLDNIDVPAADELGIVVTAPRGANAISVAEHTVGLALAVARRLITVDRETRAGSWNRLPGMELARGTWGMLGFGATARALTPLVRAFGMQVMAHDPYVDPDDPHVAPLHIQLAGLTETVRAADILSVHLPDTDETRGLIDAHLLRHLKPAAILINVGRRTAVDEEALADACEQGRLYGAALDVRASEPPTLGRLEQLDNVVLTPHIAGFTAASQHRIAQLLATDIASVLSGSPARYAVGTTLRGRLAGSG